MTAMRFTPPDESYDGFKFRIALILCSVSGFFTALFFVKHALVLHPNHTVGLLPEPFRVIGNYLWSYYWRTANGVLELLLTLGGFGAVFWLNLPKQYFAGRYRDYGKERSSAEAKSLTLLLTLMALSLVLISVPFLTLHFPVWLSLLVKYGPVAAGLLQYLSILPDTKEIERTPPIDRLDWDMRSFDATHRSTSNVTVAKELKACSCLLPPASPDAARRFLTQGSATVTWSGVDALFRNLELLLGVSADSMTLHESASRAIEFAIGELLDSRGTQPAVIVTSDAEHRSVRSTLEERLQPIYRFGLETVPVQNLLWNNAPSSQVVAAIVQFLADKKADIAVLSHVFSGTGAVLDLKELIDAARKQNLRTLFVIDGSEAIGNVMVNDDSFARSAFYAFHGHGWLLGSPSVGILIRNGWLLRVTAGMQQETPATRPFSSVRLALSDPMPPSYDTFFPWFAFNHVLKNEWLAVGVEKAVNHSNKLAALFRDEMHKRDIRTIGLSRQSSAVVITNVPQMEALLPCTTIEAIGLQDRSRGPG